MIKLDLQFFGGRGSSSGSDGSLSRGGGGNVNILSTTDVWSFRHNPDNTPGVDAINAAARKMEDDFPGLMTTVEHVNVSRLGGEDLDNTLGYYQPGTLTVAINERYADVGRMNAAYDNSVAQGYHPSRGNKSGVEAVAYHELGHALTDHIAQKQGTNMDELSATVVKNAYKKSGLTGGNRRLASQISGYAKENYMECVAEAVADYYCNGSKASRASKLIVAELKSYN